MFIYKELLHESDGRHTTPHFNVQVDALNSLARHGAVGCVLLPYISVAYIIYEQGTSRDVPLPPPYVKFLLPSAFLLDSKSKKRFFL